MFPGKQKPQVRASKKLTVLNRFGLHARPAAELVRCARSFRSSIWLVTESNRIPAAKIMDILVSNLRCGTTFTVEADGPDADKAVTQIEALLLFLKRAEENPQTTRYLDREFSE